MEFGVENRVKFHTIIRATESLMLEFATVIDAVRSGGAARRRDETGEVPVVAEGSARADAK